MRRTLLRLSAVLLAFSCLLLADEGMWLFNAAPADKIRAKYGFAPSQQWLDHVRLASVRFNNGGSGSDRKSTRLNSSHMSISYAVFCLKKKKKKKYQYDR